MGNNFNLTTYIQTYHLKYFLEDLLVDRFVVCFIKFVIVHVPIFI